MWKQAVEVSRPGVFGDRVAARTRHSGRWSWRVVRWARHSGRAALAAACAALCTAPVARAQAPVGAGHLEIDLRDGETLRAQRLVGTPEDGYRATVGSKEVRVAAGDLVAVRGGTVRTVPLLRLQLVGGDLLHGAISGGDSIGDTLELQSPVFGRVELPIDRLAAIAQPGVDDADQRLPEGVDEAVFVSTGSGYDLIAGVLHRFGPQGVLFQPEAADEPQWYPARRFSSVRLRGGLDRDQEPSCLLVSRTRDRVGVDVVRFDVEGALLRLENGDEQALRWADVACLVFAPDVVHLSSLVPAEVEESGCDGPVVYPYRVDRCCADDLELQAHGFAYGRGIGAHSRSRLTFVVPEGATHFRSRVAIDDSVASLPLRPSAVVRVLRDGEVVFEEAQLRPGEAPKDVGLHAVEPGQKITLEADFGAGRDLGDRIDWLLPMFLTRSRS